MVITENRKDIGDLLIEMDKVISDYKKNVKPNIPSELRVEIDNEYIKTIAKWRADLYILEVNGDLSEFDINDDNRMQDSIIDFLVFINKIKNKYKK